MRVRYTLISHTLTLIIAISYLTLGIAAPLKAEHVWAVYALAIFVLAVVNLYYYKRLLNARE